METAANAPADGYTVVMGSFSVLWVAPYLAGKPSMVPLFAPLSLLTTVPMVIVAKADRAELGELAHNLVVLERGDNCVVRPISRAEFAAWMKEQEAGVSELVKSGLLKPE
jgi:hypothetical protein